MKSYKLANLPKKTAEIIVEFSKDEVVAQYTVAFKKLQEKLTVDGFRPGKAPKEIAEKHIQPSAIYEEVVRALIPDAYDEVVKKENLKPVTSPKVELIKAKEHEDWQIKITVAERPEIHLGSYKEVIQKIKAEAKKDQIWVPGKSTVKPDDEGKEALEAKQKLLNNVLEALLKESKIELSDLITETELNNRLTRLVDEIQKIGLTVDSYLKSKNLTMEELKKRFTQEIEDTYKLEFMLNEIADKENVKVEDKELEKLFTGITDSKERASAQQNAYFYASVLRKQKTLDLLLTL